MGVVLAPMEGVVDAPMRAILTGLGGIDLCVTEFVRVTEQLLPRRVFYRYCPELKTGGRTSAGVPVHLQLLGKDPQLMAANAARAAQLGVLGIDLNFGCPSRTVARHGTGAVLLNHPERIHAIVAAVRTALPPAVPLSAKMRLGDQDDRLALENARAIEEAGATSLTVHARTRADGFRAPARWSWITRIRESVILPVTANGDVRTPIDYRRCRAETGCTEVMIGRGLLARPGLAREIEGNEGQSWKDTASLIKELSERMVADGVAERHIVARLKQWLVMLRKEYSQAALLFDSFKQCRELALAEALLDRSVVEQRERG